MPLAGLAGHSRHHGAETWAHAARRVAGGANQLSLKKDADGGKSGQKGGADAVTQVAQFVQDKNPKGLLREPCGCHTCPGKDAVGRVDVFAMAARPGLRQVQVYAAEDGRVVGMMFVLKGKRARNAGHRRRIYEAEEQRGEDGAGVPRNGACFA